MENVFGLIMFTVMKGHSSNLELSLIVGSHFNCH